MNEAIQQQLDWLKQAIAAYENDQYVVNTSSLVAEMTFVTELLEMELKQKQENQ